MFWFRWKQWHWSKERTKLKKSQYAGRAFIIRTDSLIVDTTVVVPTMVLVMVVETSLVMVTVVGLMVVDGEPPDPPPVPVPIKPEPVGTGRTPVPDVMPETDPVGGKTPPVLVCFFVWLTEPLGRTVPLTLG